MLKKSLISFIFILFTSFTQNNMINNDLLHELKAMIQKDQDARFKMINTENSFESVEEVVQIDQDNLPRLKEMINEFGWPGFQMIGEEGADCVWLLIQHCDQDIEFQRKCLLLLHEAVKKNDAKKTHLAYLLDRVLVNEGKEQIYGTQLQIRNGCAIPFPLQDPPNLDKRREDMGLCPFDEYLSLIEKVYHL